VLLVTVCVGFLLWKMVYFLSSTPDDTVPYDAFFLYRVLFSFIFHTHTHTLVRTQPALKIHFFRVRENICFSFFTKIRNSTVKKRV